MDNETLLRDLQEYTFRNGISQGNQLGTALHARFEVENNNRDKQSGELSMEEKVRLYMLGKNIGNLNNEDVEKFLLSQKKKRHLDGNERAFLNKPPDDGNKPTSSLKLDDVV